MYGTKTTRSIRNKQALTNGGMLSSALNRKIEETDPLLIDAIAQVDVFHDQEDYYTNYVRKQIVDRRLEEPWLESDIPSRSFLENDPRGKQIGPDINKISKQIQQRKTDFNIGMGSNADTQDNTHVFSTQREEKINEVAPPSETNYYTNSGNNAPSYVPWCHVMGETKLPVQKYGK
ncbi:2262_t:CDS:2, partial [Diversispora eburnea]